MASTTSSPNRLLWHFTALLLLVLPVQANAAPSRAEINETVRSAFRATHDGWSSDEVVLNDELNQKFLKRCQEAHPDVDAAVWNWSLMNLRKAGKLDVKSTKRRAERHDPYLHAAEIAARFMADKHGLSTDRMMCDPKLRAEFDQIAAAAAPGVDRIRLRRAAFSLRKARKLQPELVVRVANWQKQVLALPAKQIIDDKKRVPSRPGVYIFRDDTGYLYIGESSDLRQRVAQHLDHSDRKSLAHYLWKNGVASITVELHIFDPESDARLKSMRRAYESELIRSRKPKFNLAP